MEEIISPERILQSWQTHLSLLLMLLEVMIFPEQGRDNTLLDLLVINQIDLAPYVRADLGLMILDTQRVRGTRPFCSQIVRLVKESLR